MERVREDTRVDTEARLRGELLEELLAGEVVSRESLVRRARHLGADLSEGAVAVVGRLQDPPRDGRGRPFGLRRLGRISAAVLPTARGALGRPPLSATTAAAGRGGGRVRGEVRMPLRRRYRRVHMARRRRLRLGLGLGESEA